MVSSQSIMREGKGNLSLLLILGGKGGDLRKNYKDMQNY